MSKSFITTLVFSVACALFQTTLQAQAVDENDFPPVTDAMLRDPPAEDWLMWRRTLNSWGFSPLDEINKSNVNELRMVWTRALTAGSQPGQSHCPSPVVSLPRVHEYSSPAS